MEVNGHVQFRRLFQNGPVFFIIEVAVAIIGMRLPSFETQLLDGPFQFLNRLVRVFGCQSGKAEESVRVLTDRLREFVIASFRELGPKSWFELLDPGRGETKHLNIHTCLIHLFEPAFTTIKQIIQKRIPKRLTHIRSIPQPSILGGFIDHVTRIALVFFHGSDIVLGNEMGFKIYFFHFLLRRH